MAAPSYTEDLTDISLAESTTDYSAIGGGGAGLGTGADFAMQGTLCVDKQITGADKGILYDEGTGITLGTDHVFQWLYMATPGLADTLALRGACAIVGSSTNAYVKYHVEGTDTYGAAGRVGKCYVIDYATRTSNTGSAPYRTVTGSPGATAQVFGVSANTTASVKGANLGCDAVRYGTGAYITAGDSGDPATFGGFSTENDSVTNRWGILTDIGGTYELQGRFVIGQNNAGTATLAYFDDSDVNIVLVDTVHAASDFTQIIIDHASTEAYLTNINITALGTTNPGRFVVNDASSTVEITGGTWTSIGITTLRAGCVIDGLTWRQCSTVTSNSASISNALFDRSSAASSVVVADLGELDICEFVSDGSNHAIELTSVGDGTMDWNHTLSGYVAGAAGSPVTPTSTGNEALYVNVGSGTLTVNVLAGATIPSIRSAGATVNVVAGQVTTTITVVDIDTGSPIQNANVYVVAGTGGPLTAGDVIIGTTTLTDVSGQVTDVRSLASNQPITGRARRASAGFGTLYKTVNIVGTINSASGLDLTVQMQKDE